MHKNSILRPLFLSVLVYILCTYSVLFLAPQAAYFMAGKEMLLENLGALWFLASSCLCFVTFRRMRKSACWNRHGARLFLVLSLLFFAAFGEEISWGQQWFHFSTPQSIEDLNQQGELTLHNLRVFDSRTANGERRGGLMFLLNSNRLFDYFMVVFIVLPPLTVKWWSDNPIRSDATRTAGLIFPFLFLLAINYMMTFAWLLATDSPAIADATSEIRESNNALLALAVCIYWTISVSSSSWEGRNPVDARND